MKSIFNKTSKGNKKNNLKLQLIKFGIVGVIAAAVDVGTLVILKEIFKIGVLISSAVGFSVSVCVNYTLSMAIVFNGKNKNKFKEFVLFVILSLGGLGINQLILWVGAELLSVYYLVVKFAAMVIVPIYNFTTRKIFLESK